MESSKDDYGVSVSALALSKVGLGPRPGTKEDNFYTPRNEAFYSKYKYCPLSRKRPTVRLLKVYPEEKTIGQHIVDHPHWKISGYNPAPVGFPSVNPFSQNGSSEEKLLACDVLDGVPLSVCTGRYLALSYAAGDHRNTAKILVGGHIFNAFAQLIHALKCAVDYWNKENGCRDGYFLFWVDQICINQSDDVERGHQVMMMRDIYSRGATTLVCLSNADKENPARPFSSFNTQPQGFGKQAGLWGPTEAEKPNAGLGWLPLQGSTSLVDIFWKDCYNGGPSPETLASFVAFLRSPWWTRSWVYQEFVCSPKVHFVFGEYGASWERISACLTPEPGSWCNVWRSRLTSKDHQDVVRAKDEQLDQQRAQQNAEEGQKEPGRGTIFLSIEEKLHKQVNSLIEKLTTPDVELSMRTVAAMMNGRSKHDSQVGDLRVLLHHARNFHSSDARDKIYAFVGLARDDYGFEPSYSDENTPLNVHSDAARRIVEIDKDLNYVLEQAFVGRRDLGFFLPSWVPDWNCNEDRDILLELQSLPKEASESPGPLALLTDWPAEVPDPYTQGIKIKNKGLSLQVTGRYVVTLPRGSHEISPNLQRFETDSGLVIYAPSTARPKDEIWSLSGCEWLVFLRNEGKDKYCFGGFVVVHGLEEKSTFEKETRRIFLI
ncbi:Heterokaryon incompatibility protein [Fusarium globosum]|uniref:Heterokaryon incompatibility protein n=1 Tax=Fusarium globosum TaxID=78864 RepID=A0A8H5XJ29_9HYPO|nr:Heterokaryon incompatibility protein [Fusarium globosum]